jgi:hypothetical protein
MANVALVWPAGIGTVAGTVADALLLVSVTEYPAGAALLIVTVAVVGLPPMTNFGAAIDTDVTVGGVTVSGAVFVTEPSVAEIVAVTEDSSAAVVTANVAVVAPATVTVGGTVIPAETLSLESAIAVPPVGAGLEIVTVPIAPAAPSTLAGETDRLTNPGGVMDSGAVPVRPDVEAERIAVVVAETGIVVMLKVADV